MRATMLSISILVLLIAAATAACTAASKQLPPGERTVYLAAIEPKGSTTVDKEPFPTKPLPEGGGYALDGPNDEGIWTIETYRWLPSEITVTQGDTVTLEALGVNGALHPATIEGYDVSFDVKRGEVSQATFTADKAGVFKIVCSAHQPSMTGTLIVLPR